MRVIEPSQFPKHLKKKRHPGALIIFVTVVLIVGYNLAAYAKPLPGLNPALEALQTASLDPPSLDWPATGQAAVGGVGYGVLGESGAQTTAPIASVAKVMTALAVLKQKPLKVGDQGPIITLDDQDVQSYYDYIDQGGSVVAVGLGETISEYQALQALLLPSANNIASTLTRWAFGSNEAYLSYANKLAASLGLKQTHIADASGFSAQTKSTPHDLVTLGINALQNSVLAEIVKQKTATIPVEGEVQNTNLLLGQNAVDGIKTGNTAEAGGCLLFSSTQGYPNGKQVTLVGAVMGSPTLGGAMTSSAALLRSAVPGFHAVTVLKKDQIIAHYDAPWHSQATARATQEVYLLVWAGTKTKIEPDLRQINAPAQAGAEVGQILVEAGPVIKTVPVTLDNQLSAPSAGWRLTNFF